MGLNCCDNLAPQPCACGYLGDRQRQCRCSPQQIGRYQEKLSGPLLDRIDLHVNVNRIPIEQLQNPQKKCETSAIIAKRVADAHKLQMSRAGINNGQMNNTQLEKLCPLDEMSKTLLLKAVDKLALSTRSYHKCIKLARTIADLEGAQHITSQHIGEALSYRYVDKSGL